MRLLRVLVVTALVLVLASPALAQRRRTRRPTKPRTPPIAQLGVTTASGLTYVVTKRGDGRKPLKGETVTVHYTGTLTNGTKFDSSHDRGEPISFPLGAGRVIKGWDEGIAKLGVGDHAVLVIPPELGYGERGAGGVIPPNATLVFVVELVGIEGQ
jgi:FKBP-type peptidyl-prolyl cis-trans isomerase